MATRIWNKIPLISNRTKITISFSLFTLAFITCCFRPNSVDSKICLVAMLFSLFGDIALNCLPLDKRPHSMLYIGAFFFMVSHRVYAAAYYWLISHAEKSLFNIGLTIACLMLVILFIASSICICISQKSLKKSMIFVFSLYFVVISINFITIYSYSWSFKAISFIGATSFLISDYIIGLETIFKIKSNTLRKLVWLFYPIGQILIILCR